jgi:Caspase domain
VNPVAVLLFAISESIHVIGIGQTMIKLVRTWVIVALCGLSCVLLSTDAARADRKVALVVGNTQYKNAGLVLFNPKNDAEDVAAALRMLDFEVVLVVDASKRDFDSAMTQFARLATGADAAFFYYAGHAMQFQGRNYLMPTDGELEDEVSLRYQMVTVDDVRAAVERADGVKIVVLDACRNNPVIDNLRRKIVGVSRNVATTRGLARPDKAVGMVVAYSTAADEVAADGTGRNSPFTSALLRRLREPGLEIGSMFRLIAADVNEKTNGHQRPETYISLIGEYYLNEKDKPAWEQIKDSNDPAAFRNFVAQFPTSPRASDAQYRLRILERLAKQFDLNGAASDRIQPPAPRDSAQASQQSPPADSNRPKIATTEPKRPQPSASDTISASSEQKQAGVATEPVKGPPPVLTKLTQEQVCKRDAGWLVHVRATQSLEEVISLERELGCEKLRPQVLRLKESLGLEVPRAESSVIASAGATRATQVSPRSSVPAVVPSQPVQTAAVGTASPDSGAQAQPAASPEDTCKRDEEKLVRLRTNPSLDQIVRFEQELRCPRLRPQIARLRESVGAN